jgi:hypothetical protein
MELLNIVFSHKRNKLSLVVLMLLGVCTLFFEYNPLNKNAVVSGFGFIRFSLLQTVLNNGFIPCYAFIASNYYNVIFRLAPVSTSKM